MAYMVKTPYKKPVKREPISLDRFFLLKGTMAGISLLLLSIPYGMTTTYVAMYADEIGITVNSGLYFTFMAIGLAVSRLFSGRQVDRGRVTYVITLGMYLAVLSFFALAGLRYIANWSLVHCSLARRCVRHDVPRIQCVVRQSGTQQPTRDSDLDLSNKLGCRNWYWIDGWR